MNCFPSRFLRKRIASLVSSGFSITFQHLFEEGSRSLRSDVTTLFCCFNPSQPVVVLKFHQPFIVGLRDDNSNGTTILFDGNRLFLSSIEGLPGLGL